MHPSACEKVGMRSDTANATLRVALRTALPAFVLRIEYVESYENFGLATLQCVGGCTCVARTLRARTRARRSVSAFADTRLEGATPTCAVAVTVAVPSFKIVSMAITGDDVQRSEGS